MLNTVRAILLVLVSVIQVQSYDYPFQDPSLPVANRVNDLVSRLTIDEIILQLSRGGAGQNGPAPAIARLGIPPYQWNTECLRGVGAAGDATSFPHTINMAATFDRSTVFAVANATAAEARGKFNTHQTKQEFGDHTGISCFAPVLNIMRHPLWGRNQETYGEDPHLTGEMTRAFVSGLQGSHPRYVQASACCKHFAVHNGPEDKPVSRWSFDAKATPKDMWLTYLPAFEACVGAGSLSVMCSYNALNGVPACVNKWLLTDVLRDKWNFTGYVVSDEGALEFAVDAHQYSPSYLEAAVSAIDAGVNLELAILTTDHVFKTLTELVNQGRVSTDRLKELVKPLFATRMRLGLFDPAEMNPYNSIQQNETVQSSSHRSLSTEVARKSFVMLKNNGIVPLKKKVEKLAVIGPFATNMEELYGDYSADRMPQFEISVAEGMKPLGETLIVAEGCTDGAVCEKFDSASVDAALASASLAIVTLGTGQNLEAEMNDRESMNLPKNQVEILKRITRPGAPPVILFIFTGGPVASLSWAVEATNVQAIFWCGFPAQMVGRAMQQILWVDTSLTLSWGGRLPFTWYVSEHDIADIVTYDMVNQTYRYFPDDAPLQFPFGYGLTISTFTYSDLNCSARVAVAEDIQLSVTLQNAGPFDADEVTQVYLTWRGDAARTMPQRQLVGFRRLRMQLGSKNRHSLDPITRKQRQVWAGSSMADFNGEVEVLVGGQQPGRRVGQQGNTILSCRVVIV